MFRLRHLFYLFLIKSIDANVKQLGASDICYLCCHSNESLLKIDSMAYITDQKQYFFTSAGHYWLLNKSEEFPSMVFGRPLPKGFKKGEAAFYLDTSNGCAKKSTKKLRRIHLFERTENGNQVMVLDIDTNKWYRKAIFYKSHKIVSSAQVNWTETIEAMFTYKDTNVVVVMANYYFVVDIKGLCDSDIELKQQWKRETNDDFTSVRSDRQMDAMTMINDSFGLIFKGQHFWFFEVKSFKKGKFARIITYSKKKVIEDFFKINYEIEMSTRHKKWFCQSPKGRPPTDNDYFEEVNPTFATNVPILNASVPEIDKGVKTVDTTSEPESETIWIIAAVIVVIFIVVLVGLLAFLALRKSRLQKAMPQFVAPTKMDQKNEKNKKQRH